MSKTKQFHASSWLGDWSSVFEKEEKLDKSQPRSQVLEDKRNISFERIVRLAAAKRAVTNFVQIVVGKRIPVFYDTSVKRGGTTASINATDGKQVFIGANINNKNFDAFVGIALHEASHIKYSQAALKFLRDFRDSPELFISSELMKVAVSKGYKVNDIHVLLQMLMNLVEDRRIDKLLYNAAPGYQPYYDAMYHDFWLSKEIDKMLRSDLKTDPTLENYLDRLINFVNPNFRPEALPGLDKCVSTIDVANIDRLNSDSTYQYRSLDETMMRRVSLKGLNPLHRSNSPEIYKVAEQVAIVIFTHVREKNSTPQVSQSANQTGSPLGNPSIGNFGQPDQNSPGQSNSSASSNEENDSDEYHPGPMQSPTTDDNPQSGNSSGNSEGDSGEDTDGEDSGASGEGDIDNDSNNSGKSGPSSGSTGNADSDADKSSEDSEPGNSDGKGTEIPSTGGDEVTARENDESPDSEDTGENGPELSDEDVNALENAMSSEMTNPKPKPIKINEEKLKKALKQQRDFLNGNVKKAKISPDEAKKVDILGASGSTIHQVGESIFKGDCKCIITRRLTPELVKSDIFEFGSDRPSLAVSQAVKTGFRLGEILAQRLAIRNDDNSLKYTRQTLGHIDKRLLAQIGAGVESIFTRVHVEQFKPVFVHLTIDASGSMMGTKFENALTMASALCFAADKIRNIEISVSIRAGTNGLAHIAMIYDSRKDKPTLITSLWKYLHVASATPEGLTFEAICEELMSTATGQKELYFINISDGQPAFSTASWGRGSWGSYESYSGFPAAKHTRTQINRLIEVGFKIMSYFVSDGDGGNENEVFKASYGPAAEFINVTEINSLLRTLNKLFLQRN